MSKKMMAVIVSVTVVLVVALMLSFGSNKTNQQQREQERIKQEQEQEQERIKQEQEQERIKQRILSLEVKFETSTGIFNDDEESLIEIRAELYSLKEEVSSSDYELKERINKLIKKCDDEL